ncbi:MAG: YigZ family protein [Clostridia bacterium]|nr:YigZ family protein [Clostridia bacterium]
MNEYTTVTRMSRYEYEDRRSVFIGEAAPVSTEAEALLFLESVKKKYPDARHHVYAYVLRADNTRRFSDDREPQGTAGLPVLEAITKRGYTDTIVVVTRYFGGTLLGTGGLVRAYTEAAVGALEEAKPAVYARYAVVSFTLSYSDFQKFAAIATACDFRTEDTEYTDTVRVRGSLRVEKTDRLREKVSELTGGGAEVFVEDEIFSF